MTSWQLISCLAAPVAVPIVVTFLTVSALRDVLLWYKRKLSRRKVGK